jgi:hypothetical protein
MDDEAVRAAKAKLILSIPLDQPGKLFTGNEEEVTTLYRTLARLWQPRKASDDSSVMTHINALRDRALEMLGKGLPLDPNKLRLVSKGGQKYDFKFLRKYDFELGECYIGRDLLLYTLTEADLYECANYARTQFRFADDKMREEMQRNLPAMHNHFKTADRCVLVMQKPRESVRLRDLRDHLGGQVDPVHVAWMVSRLCGIACWLQYTGLVHGDISLDSCYVWPKDHTIALLGGWWYSNKIGGKMIALPRRSYDFRVGGVASRMLDAMLVRQTGLEILSAATAPEPMLMWLYSAPNRSSVEDFRAWHKALERVFGVRKFVPMSVTIDEVYK